MGVGRWWRPGPKRLWIKPPAAIEKLYIRTQNYTFLGCFNLSSYLKNAELFYCHFLCILYSQLFLNHPLPLIVPIFVHKLMFNLCKAH